MKPHKIIILTGVTFKSRNSSVGIAMGYRLDDRCSRVRLPAGAGNFSLHHRVQNGSGAHSAYYPMGTRGSFPGVNRPGSEADHSPPSSAEIKEWVALYLHSPNTPPWRGAQLKHRDNFTFTGVIFDCGYYTVLLWVYWRHWRKKIFLSFLIVLFYLAVSRGFYLWIN
jgi:hypothetical protein